MLFWFKMTKILDCNPHSYLTRNVHRDPYLSYLLFSRHQRSISHLPRDTRAWASGSLVRGDHHTSAQLHSDTDTFIKCLLDLWVMSIWCIKPSVHESTDLIDKLECSSLPQPHSWHARYIISAAEMRTINCQGGERVIFYTQCEWPCSVFRFIVRVAIICKLPGCDNCWLINYPLTHNMVHTWKWWTVKESIIQRGLKWLQIL